MLKPVGGGLSVSSPIKKITSFRAKLISDKVYPAIVENLSGTGLYIRASSNKPTSDLTPGKTLKVNFNSDSGEEISILCRILWSYKTPPYGITDSLGMEVIDPLSNYEEFYKTL
jgi:hypothetical protein